MTFSSFSLSFQVLDHHLIMNWWMDLFFFCFTDFKVFNKSSLELISNEFYFRCNDRLWNKKIIYKIDVIIIIIIIDHLIFFCLIFALIKFVHFARTNTCIIAWQNEIVSHHLFQEQFLSFFLWSKKNDRFFCYSLP